MINAKYRGLRTDGKGWVIGYLVDWRKHGGDCEIMDLSHAYDVLPETVGQYTGKPDKNGKDIYDGDIGHCNGENYKVCLQEVAGAYKLINIRKEDDWHFLLNANILIEIIGNIHEKGGEE